MSFDFAAWHICCHQPRFLAGQLRLDFVASSVEPTLLLPDLLVLDVSLCGGTFRSG